jgi:nucleoside-diphosphate-sugar epimerase
MVVRVFVAGGTGALGRRLVPQLVARGHQVTATTTSEAKLGLLAQLGADGVVMDGLDAVSVGAAVAAARPDTIVHQMTAVSTAQRLSPKWLARVLAGEVAVTMMTEGRGFSNAKAKRELGWQLRYPSWPQGFKDGLA